jgi:molecular chaperone GrpE
MADEQDKETHTETAEQAETEEQAEGAAAEAGGEEDVETLKEQLQQAQAQAEENWNQVLRTRAELENARRRAEKDIENAKAQAMEKFAGEMLSVKDSLEMGVQAAQDDSADVAKLREGSELTLRMMDQAMEKFQIQPIDPDGQRFDPSYHEAMAAQPSAEHEPNTVMNVVQKGYALGERLIRPARVIVAKAEESSQQGGDDAGSGDDGNNET